MNELELELGLHLKTVEKTSLLLERSEITALPSIAAAVRDGEDIESEVRGERSQAKSPHTPGQNLYHHQHVILSSSSFDPSESSELEKSGPFQVQKSGPSLQKS